MRSGIITDFKTASPSNRRTSEVLNSDIQASGKAGLQNLNCKEGFEKACNSTKNVIESSGNVTVINSTEVEAEGENAKTESNVSTTLNGEKVTVKTNQPGSVEVKNIDGKVEIKTSKGITPTITKEKQSSFSKTENNKVPSIYSFLKGFFKRVFGSFFRKT